MFFELRSVTYQYPASHHSVSHPALEKIDLCIQEGEFVSIVGANGSGKSTLAKLFNALLLPTNGKVIVAGLDTREAQNHVRIRGLVGMVFQFPEDQIVSTVVEEDVAFGPANLGLPRQEIFRRVNDALARVGLEEHRNRPPHMLSAGQLQRLALAGVLARQPSCIVFDEATTMLDPLGRKMVLRLMHELHQEGKTIIYVTHHMEEAVQADRMLVLEHGQIVLDGAPSEIFSHTSELHSLGLGLPDVTSMALGLNRVIPQIKSNIYIEEDLYKELQNVGIRKRCEMSRQIFAGDSDNEIEVSHLQHTYLRGTPLQHVAIDDMSLFVKKNGKHGLLGHTGSGKSTLLQHLNGILRPQNGLVKVGGFVLNDPAVDRFDVCRHVGLMFQNPEMQFFETYVGDEIAYGARQFQRAKELAAQVRMVMELVGLNFEDMKDRPVYSLSGGERRKVALASILVWQPDILLLDEPTAGLDPRSRHEIVLHLSSLAPEVTLVLSSHRMEDLVVLVETGTALSQGRDFIHGELWEIFEQKEKLAIMGLEPPVAVRVSDQLRILGWNIPAWITTQEALVRYLEVAL